MDNPPEPAPAAAAANKPAKLPLGSRLRLVLWKLISLVLLVALVAAIVLWKPWQANIKASDRTVSVTGTATVKAEPDEYVFSPSYTFTNVDKQTALGEITAKSNDMIAKLKALGVADSQIKNNSTNY